MFESAEIGHRLGKRDYDRQLPKLRQALLAVQYDLLRKAAFPVVVLVNGVDGAGKGETVNLLNEWMDPRHIHTYAFGEMTDEERSRPEMWRFWRALPPKGRIGILFGSWYTVPILNRVMEHEKRASFERRLEKIRRFERMLVAEDAVVVKLWFHLSKEAQRRRMKQLSSRKTTAWMVSPDDWKRFRQYDAFLEVCEDALRGTSTGEAPWNIIEGSDPEYRSLTAGKILLDAMHARLERRKRRAVAPNAPPPTPAIDGRSLLHSFDYRTRITQATYERRLAKAQARLSGLTRSDPMRKRALILVFEGMDAAGKGGAIRRITGALDARYYRVIPVAAPSDEETAQPYLWRFWRHIPPRGSCAIFDRSWYGRVLVERVEHLCREDDWMRAYNEVNDFEEQLCEKGGIVAKFWLAVTPREQLRRFRERERTPWKRFKITAEDWRNRKSWPLYEAAVCDMIDQTSTDKAPWNVVASDDKLTTRVTIAERLCKLIEARL